MLRSRRERQESPYRCVLVVACGGSVAVEIDLDAIYKGAHEGDMGVYTIAEFGPPDGRTIVFATLTERG